MSYIGYSILDNFLRFQDDVDFTSLNITGSTVIDGNLKTNSHVTCSSDLIFTSSNLILSSTVDFSSSLGVLFTGSINTFITGTRVGINTLNPTNNLHISGTAILDGFEFIDSTNNIFAYSGLGNSGLYIGDVTPTGRLTVSGNVRFDNGTFTYNQATGKASIKTSTTSEAYLRVFGGLVTAADINEPDVTLLSSDGSTDGLAVWQQICQFTQNQDSDAYLASYTQGLMFTGADPPPSLLNKHWYITLQLDETTTFPDPPTPGTGFRSNRLLFCFINNATTTPAQAMIDLYLVKGFLALDRNSSPAGAIDFTGQHRTLNYDTQQQFEPEAHRGLIVCSAGVYCPSLNIEDEKTAISINEAIPKIILSSKRNDKTVLGVISDKEDEEEKRTFFTGNWASVFDKRADEHRLIINSLGEGGIWVCNINGNLENGDYITTCEVPGYGMKQDAENIKNYTVAKITCDCDFDLQSTIYQCEEFQFNGSTYRRAFVGCTYHCG